MCVVYDFPFQLVSMGDLLPDCAPTESNLCLGALLALVATCTHVAVGQCESRSKSQQKIFKNQEEDAACLFSALRSQRISAPDLASQSRKPCECCHGTRGMTRDVAWEQRDVVWKAESTKGCRASGFQSSIRLV